MRRGQPGGGDAAACSNPGSNRPLAAVSWRTAAVLSGPSEPLSPGAGTASRAACPRSAERPGLRGAPAGTCAAPAAPAGPATRGTPRRCGFAQWRVGRTRCSPGLGGQGRAGLGCLKWAGEELMLCLNVAVTPPPL